MPDKRRDLRARIRTNDLVDPDEIGRTAARTASKALFVLGFLAIIGIASAINSLFLQLLIIGPTVSAFVYAVVPVHALRRRARWLYSGDAGEAAYNHAQTNTTDEDDLLGRWR
jgi:hypothetical protein